MKIKLKILSIFFVIFVSLSCFIVPVSAMTYTITVAPNTTEDVLFFNQIGQSDTIRGYCVYSITGGHFGIVFSTATQIRYVENSGLRFLNGSYSAKLYYPMDNDFATLDDAYNFMTGNFTYEENYRLTGNDGYLPASALDVFYTNLNIIDSSNSVIFPATSILTHTVGSNPGSVDPDPPDENEGFFESIWNWVSGFFDRYITIVQNFLLSIKSFFNDLKSSIDGLMAPVIDWFSWDQSSYNSFRDNIKSATNGNSFVSTVSGFISRIKNYFSSVNEAGNPFDLAPAIEIPLGNYEGQFGEGSYGSGVSINFGVFERWIDQIRFIISVILWVFFIWRLFARLPSIIRGESSVISTVSKN